jgi:hypothetical protein
MVVKFAGLDPRAFESGKSVRQQPRLTKAGNHPIRSALYRPALSAPPHDTYVRAYSRHLVDNGQKPLQRRSPDAANAESGNEGL